MSFIAFEVSLNGVRQYTVGAENWKHISAILLGNYIDPSDFPPDSDEDDLGLSNEPFTHVQLRSTISVSGEDVQITDPQGNLYTESKSGHYPPSKLSPGDVVEIRVIETDKSDCPEWQKNDPRFPVSVVVSSNEPQ